MSKERPKRNIIQKKYVSIDPLYAVDLKFVRWCRACVDVKRVNFDHGWLLVVFSLDLKARRKCMIHNT